MIYKWTHEGGVWRTPVGDGTIELEIYEDELDELPPLVEARAEVARLRALLKTADVFLYDVDGGADGRLDVDQLDDFRSRIKAALQDGEDR